MSFLFPTFLLALAAAAVPVIIHLFNFRKFRRLRFTNVRFLQEIKQETDSRSRIKHWLILAARVLTLVFLVLAFAQPYIPTA
ncbi:MAG TPA: BatA domain-containing protein, partial [Anseongella sp.]|nr:BatA domain-containing protein [Anseongella sp.]